MGLQDDVIKCGKKLEKMIETKNSDPSVSMDILKTLKKLPMTLEVLQKTRIGMTVNSFRKSSSNDEVVSLAKSLIKNWKKLLPGDNNSQSEKPAIKSSTSSSSTKEEPKPESSPKEEAPQSSNEQEGTSSEKGSGDEQQADTSLDRQASLSSEPIPHTDDPIRLKCRELLTNALLVKPFPDNCTDAKVTAAHIEDCIYTEFVNTDMKYKNRVRSRVSNLKDAKNPNLRCNVHLGIIPPEKMAVMTAEEMASDEMRKLRSKLTKEAINDHQMSTNSGTVTDLFKCGRCGKRRCTYTQLQTRSSDEPMTTFVVCNDCGNRWKFC